MDQIGAIRVPRMIWSATILSLGVLAICWYNCAKTNPTILQTTLEYPYTVYFRIGMMYSLFIFFLVFVFIKWWLDQYPQTHNTRKIFIFGLLGVMSYGLFVSTIDRKRMNYYLARFSAAFANICITIALSIIAKNIKDLSTIHNTQVSSFSFGLKKILFSIHSIANLIGIAIYLGFVGIELKPLVEYTLFISTVLILWSFIFEFKKFKMDIDEVPKLQTQTQQQIDSIKRMGPYQQQQNQNRQIRVVNVQSYRY